MEDQRTRPYTRFQHKYDTLRDFPAFLEDYFNPYMKAAGYERTFDWSEVGRFYNNSQDTLSICYALKIFCEFVLKLFLRFDCGNERLIMLITYLYHQVKVRCHGNTEAIFCQDCEELNCRKQYHLNSQPLLKEVNEKTEHVYNAQNFPKHSFYIYTRILSQYKEDDAYYYDFLQFLLKYGLFFIPNSEKAVFQRFNFL